ncbi:MAG: 2-oxoacid:acceptor oxidoreductase family protein [Candidatus Bathyarchaeia archaeon]
MDLAIRLAGESGDGVILAGEVLTYAVSRMGLKIFTFRTYPSSVRGGPCMYQLRVSDWHAYSQGDMLDLLNRSTLAERVKASARTHAELELKELLKSFR